MPCDKGLLLCTLQFVRLVQIPRRITTFVDLLDREAVPQVRKSIPFRSVLICVQPIFSPKALQHMKEVNPAAGMQGSHGPVLGPTFEPRPTRALPGSTWHERVNVLRKFGNTLGGWRNSGDSFGLALFDDANNVFCNVLSDGEDAAMAYGSIGAEKH